MRIFRIKTLFPFLILLTITKCYGQSDTVISNWTIIEGNGIKSFINLGDQKKSIRKRFGKTDKCKVTISHVRLDCWGDGSRAYNKTKTENKRYHNFYCYKDLDLKIAFKKRRVSSIYIANNKYTTTKGATIGTYRKTILRIYGGESDSPIVRYADQGLAFAFDEEDKVIEIWIFKPY
jgi:hypothetical protein